VSRTPHRRHHCFAPRGDEVKQLTQAYRCVHGYQSALTDLLESVRRSVDTAAGLILAALVSRGTQRKLESGCFTSSPRGQTLIAAGEVYETRPFGVTRALEVGRGYVPQPLDSQDVVLGRSSSRMALGRAFPLTRRLFARSLRVVSFNRQCDQESGPHFFEHRFNDNLGNREPQDATLSKGCRSE